MPERYARVRIVNQTGKRLREVSYIHRYSTDYYRMCVFRNLEHGAGVLDAKTIQYRTGIFAAGDDWWLIRWQFEDGTVYSSSSGKILAVDPVTLRGVLDVEDIIRPAAGAPVSTVGVIDCETGALISSDAMLSLLRAACDMDLHHEPKWAGYRSCMLYAEDEGRIVTITIRPGLEKNITIAPGKSRSKLINSALDVSGTTIAKKIIADYCKQQVMVAGVACLTAEAWCQLGQEFFSGVRPGYQYDRYVSARMCYEEAIQQSVHCVVAYYELSKIYQEGYGVPKSQTEAKRFALQALAAVDALGLEPSSIILYARHAAVLCETATGADRDKVKAKECYQKAAQLGCLISIQKILEMDHGDLSLLTAERWYSIGQQRDFARSGGYYFACFCYQEALKKNPKQASSLKALGVLYEEGRGVTRDLAVARVKYQAAIDHGGCYFSISKLIKWDHPRRATVEGWYELGREYQLGIRGGGRSILNHKRARACYEHGLSINNRHADTHDQLATFYRYGHGVDQDLNRAKDHYREAAQLGHVESMEILLEWDNPACKTAQHWYELGQHYYLATGGKQKDETRARLCYQRALKIKSDHSCAFFIIEQIRDFQEDLNAFLEKRFKVSVDLLAISTLNAETIGGCIEAANSRRLQVSWDLAKTTCRDQAIMTIALESIRAVFECNQAIMIRYYEYVCRVFDEAILSEPRPFLIPQDRALFTDWLFHQLSIHLVPDDLLDVRSVHQSLWDEEKQQLVERYIDQRGVEYCAQVQSRAIDSLKKKIPLWLAKVYGGMDGAILFSLPLSGPEWCDAIQKQVMLYCETSDETEASRNYRDLASSGAEMLTVFFEESFVTDLTVARNLERQRCLTMMVRSIALKYYARFGSECHAQGVSEKHPEKCRKVAFLVLQRILKENYKSIAELLTDAEKLFLLKQIMELPEAKEILGDLTAILYPTSLIEGLDLRLALASGVPTSTVLLGFRSLEESSVIAADF